MSASDAPDTPDDKERPQQSRRIRVGDLLRGQREIILEYGGSEYRLRVTSNGKLILTK